MTAQLPSEHLAESEQHRTDGLAAAGDRAREAHTHLRQTAATHI
ncbi:hypothetical protein RM844_30210 [Streptomyces sp. DSM 44915]|uniref:Uncharacterized protein n=1 Tax=Streptomyces chisholmiae TaxID=3075540 RepID=A0ABU2JZY3_9ACTN|nr:hypothetical protein [Streptomyces sp. DSM 44915]MDT0270555.1 hypothetical protein [Streptomyces sp. DSM 44915]